MNLGIGRSSLVTFSIELSDQRAGNLRSARTSRSRFASTAHAGVAATTIGTALDVRGTRTEASCSTAAAFAGRYADTVLAIRRTSTILILSQGRACG